MEIERKFVIDRNEFLNYIKSTSYSFEKVEISQYYIPSLNGTLRLRRILYSDNTYSFILTIKKFISNGMNEEIEVNLDSNVAYEMATKLSGLKLLRKTRYVVSYEGNNNWYVDLFENGMSLAEIELNNIDEEFKHPPFLREEVTGDYKFSNEFIANHLSGN